MTRHTLLAILGIFVLFGALMPAPATAAGWSDAAYYDQASYGRNGNGNGNGNGHGNHNGNGGLFNFSPTTSKIAKIGLTATGTVLAGMFGAQFGTIGTVVGGAAGFFVSKFIGDKLFGTNNYPSHYQSSGGGIFERLKDKIFGTKNHGPFPPQYGGNNGPWRGSETNVPGGSLTDARQNFYTAMQNYTKSLQTGTQAQKEAAKAAYDAARNAYYSAKGN